MADLFHRHADMAEHPDIAEMRERYARIESARGVTALDGLVLLTGLYTAISPWVVHFNFSNPELRTNNLLVGIALAVIGMALALAPERMYRMSGVVAVIGVWMIISPWVVTVGHTATRGIIWNNVLIGAVCCLLGLAAMMGVVRQTARPPGAGR
ncbi:SPW repeat protein [Streptacidiphilus neutrinimicus]|uniref:SPW repeat protein n=1 Tax=Streptacidiphilus neutrinimicus TaxID=105420 RepID=UPI00157A517C|nr:SPW repeat protein [Streptacidiphilus neutrinimicus]